MFVTRMKFVSSVKFKRWTIVWRQHKLRHNAVIAHSISMKFKGQGHNYLSGIPNFILIEQKGTEIYSKEINREL